jgi:hypothetical protein
MSFFDRTIYFIIAIATSPSILMLYLSVIMIIPFSYAISIPIFVKKQPYLYYYLSLLTFYSLSGIVNLITHLYSILQMDTIKWGKTRKIQKTNNKDVLIDYVENITNDRIESEDGSEYRVSLAENDWHDDYQVMDENGNEIEPETELYKELVILCDNELKK